MPYVDRGYILLKDGLVELIETLLRQPNLRLCHSNLLVSTEP